MKIFQFFIIIAFIIFSCKKNNNSKEQRLKANEIKSSINIASIKDTINNNDLEYFNNLKTLGKGLIKVNNRNSITVFKNNEKTIEHIYNPSITPIFFKPDYGIFYLVCISEKNENYEIQIDEENTAILPKGKDLEFMSWDNFLLNTTGISNLDWVKNPLKKEPNDKSISLDINEGDDFKIIDIYHEWIQISNEKQQIGWIKWKEGNKLLIDIFLLI